MPSLSPDPRVKVFGTDLVEIASDGPPDISTPAKLALCAYAVHRAMLQRAAENSDFFKRTPPKQTTYTLTDLNHPVPGY